MPDFCTLLYSWVVEFRSCSIARVRKFLYVGKMSIFSMLLEGEASMVRWPSNHLDLTRFHDLVGSS
jgi:hypothetical protein